MRRPFMSQMTSSPGFRPIKTSSDNKINKKKGGLMTAGRPKRVLNIFVLAMLNVSIMASLRNLPFISSFGLNSIFYFLLVALFFLIPQALVAAELATGWQ